MTKKEARGHIARTVTTWEVTFNDGRTEIRTKMPNAAELKTVTSVTPITKTYAISKEAFMANAEEVTD